MNDKEIFKLTEITSRTGIEKITFEFEDAYCDIVYCTIRRTFRESIPVQSRSTNSDDALKRALVLLESVKPWDSVLKMPSKEKQPYYHGYYREMLDAEHEVEFKNVGMIAGRFGDEDEAEFAVTGIHRKDSNGFYYAEERVLVDNTHTFVKDLEDGTQLYTWDDIQALSGTAGELIVKDGVIIKSKMTAIS